MHGPAFRDRPIDWVGEDAACVSDRVLRTELLLAVEAIYRVTHLDAGFVGDGPMIRLGASDGQSVRGGLVLRFSPDTLVGR